ncbi:MULTISPECIES: ABC transporter permease [unclassified Shinella]|uniref:ABC transporter permease n=1 Tax=unclassified Shinella TaxID=2643062 RepID=UPI00225D1DCA|nr:MULTISPECIES: ABC transporter permease [unclassified Shinella]MCO5139832.1 ABC transporter permease [Shinella sp.]MDC7258531.1 ABC transporter permease [Shinella sp. YE25]CAI0334871.1 galactofuranose ABC transporter putative membrane subunit YtfT [Rhizobiaceae bacterium]CAK7260296.1 galactofuranose ABC transporter putative membrane subunit YtfT [Shinella sp. WSC3-e]
MNATLKTYAVRLFPQVAALAVILLMVSIAFPGFFRLEMQNGRLYGSLIDILNRGAPVALLAIGMTVVIATKGIDLSVGAVMAICGAVAAACITAGYGLALTLLVTIGTGLLCGLWNGFLVAVLDIQPIIATLVLMVAGRGIAQLITEGAILTFNDAGLIFLGSGSLFGLPMPVVIWLVFGLAVALIVRRTALGMLIEALGVNRRASMLSGVSTGVLLIAAYVLSGLCAALAGIIAAADIRGADANNAGLWLELDAILAVVVGGTSLLGGRFSIAASLLGALIIQSINTGILLSGFPPEFNLIIKAAIIVLILVIQSPRAQSAFVFLSRPQAASKTGEETK